MGDNSCPICGKENVEKHADYKNNAVFVMCPVCGSFVMTSEFFTKEKKDKDKIASFLYHNLSIKDGIKGYSSCFLGTRNEYEQMKDDYGDSYLLTEKEVVSFQPKSFSERIDRVLLALGYKSKYFGNELRLSNEEEFSLLFVTRYDENGFPLHTGKPNTQAKYLIEYLRENKYISAKIGLEGGHAITLLADGWKRIELAEKSDDLNKNVFVSMSFAEDTKPTREAIRSGITDAGFSAEFLDEIKHNHQIIPEMFRLIRECRFLVMDITDPNYGAYYEAGYAQGLGKEVIITCSEEAFHKEYTTEEEKRYAKYLKPHFDIAQKQILLWKDTDDLSHKLSEWIKALFR